MQETLNAFPLFNDNIVMKNIIAWENLFLKKNIITSENLFTWMKNR